ncbi:NIPSNAP family protein [Sporichthya brevicatena]|uniref:NIPSNAP family protein n=1 Tax=Sporichthya brevicatena TaxID=171442 RepID=A0ABP3R840_9ACTN
MISEIREYVAMPGRLPDVIAFFHEDVIPLFHKHGMEFTQMGVTTIGDNSFGEFVYTMRFADLAEMEQKWGAFVADPGFGSALAAREAKGPLYRAIRRRVIDSGQFDHLLGDLTSD